MPIKGFKDFLRKYTERHVLKDCKLVIDAQNYFYTMYEQSGLPHKVGCQSNSFAMYLQKRLNIFKEANVTCYFVFKGASLDVEKKIKKDRNHCLPVFAKSMCKQVLDEMKFDYVTCELESKHQCAVLADKLGCPTMSNDIELAMISNCYINYSHVFNFDHTKNGIECELLHFNTFLAKHSLSKEKFFIFVLLTDMYIFPEEYFSKLHDELKLPRNLSMKYLRILQWLSKNSQKVAVNQILKSFNNDDSNNILLKIEEIKTQLTRKSPGIPCLYFLEKNKILVEKMDPKWFEKGIAYRYISKPYIQLYRDSIMEGSWVFENDAKPDAILLSIDIVKYAFNLLTNYTQNSFALVTCNGNKIKIDANMPEIPKPDYPEVGVVFENGWDNIEQLHLFQHFLRHTIKGIDLDLLQELPMEARLLMITLIYVAHMNETWGAYEAYSVMTSYVAISQNNNLLRAEGIDVDHALASYITEPNDYCSEMMYSLFQFQHCLEQMNYLNALCGYPFSRTIYSKTYNANLVYNILAELKKTKIDAFTRISELLKSAPATVTYLKTIAQIHSNMRPFEN